MCYALNFSCFISLLLYTFSTLWFFLLIMPIYIILNLKDRIKWIELMVLSFNEHVRCVEWIEVDLINWINKWENY